MGFGHRPRALTPGLASSPAEARSPNHSAQCCPNTAMMAGSKYVWIGICIDCAAVAVVVPVSAALLCVMTTEYG